MGSGPSVLDSTCGYDMMLGWGKEKKGLKVASRTNRKVKWERE